MYKTKKKEKKNEESIIRFFVVASLLFSVCIFFLSPVVLERDKKKGTDATFICLRGPCGSFNVFFFSVAPRPYSL